MRRLQILFASALVIGSTGAVLAAAAVEVSRHRAMHHTAYGNGVAANGRCHGVSYGTGVRSCGTATGGPVGGLNSRN